MIECIFLLPASRNFLHSLTYTPSSLQIRTSCQILLTMLHSVPLSYLYLLPRMLSGFLGGTGGKEPTCQYRRHKRQVQSLGQEDPPEKEIATHSSILAWRLPWIEMQACYSPWGCKKLNTTEATQHATHTRTCHYLSPTQIIQNHPTVMRTGV